MVALIVNIAKLVAITLNFIRLAATTFIVSVIAMPFRLIYSNTYKVARGNITSSVI